MPSRLQEFKAVLEAAFVAVVPADQEPPATPDPLLRYRWIDSLDEERRNGQHRELTWLRATEPDTISRHWPVEDWKITARLFLHRGTGTDAQLTIAGTDAMYELKRAWRRQATIGWGPGIVANLDPPRVVDAQQTKQQPRAGGTRLPTIMLRVDFPFRVAVREAS